MTIQIQIQMKMCGEALDEERDGIGTVLASIRQTITAPAMDPYW